ncbi:hypothetical protein AAZX31_19G028900 [Glycine max]|uniref:Uncharacterized protein n=2 Tax=Glycine subgen. Soja TaxID=1462606 RepID=K7MWA0_SOYBN|nr:hypothetical protein JHK86_052165 [Glycine max]KAG4914689.1 hypothetical protein JHK87_052246 [Glycine soja]KAG4926534.1 hypothetical protein JHK85_053020 [Glycine max]KAG5082172.1 hypothetical protein JHK84_052210 [Glycine max]KAG5084938.1 hypothetical protein JHK82_052335 [Glycine max]
MRSFSTSSACSRLHHDRRPLLCRISPPANHSFKPLLSLLTMLFASVACGERECWCRLSFSLLFSTCFSVAKVLSQFQCFTLVLFHCFDFLLIFVLICVVVMKFEVNVE